jgi:hypothetical protein
LSEGKPKRTEYFVNNTWLPYGKGSGKRKNLDYVEIDHKQSWSNVQTQLPVYRMQTPDGSTWEFSLHEDAVSAFNDDQSPTRENLQLMEHRKNRTKSGQKGNDSGGPIRVRRRR